MTKELKLSQSGANYSDKFVRLENQNGRVRLIIKINKAKNINLYFTKAEALWWSETIRELAEKL